MASTTALQPGAVADSAAACSTLCANDAACTMYAWCPDTATTGCKVPGVLGAAETSVATKGCVLSYHNTKGAEADGLGGPRRAAPPSPAR